MLLYCTFCKTEKDESCFGRHKLTNSGRSHWCKDCRKRKSAIEWERMPLNKKMYQRVKHRAKKNGIPFDLELEDIKIPEVCPVFGTPFEYGHNDLTASIDRIDPAKGYIKGNISIMSNKANRMKSDATLEEVGALYEYMKGVCEIVNL